MVWNGHKVTGCASIRGVHKFLKWGTSESSASPPCLLQPMAVVRWYSFFQPSRHTLWPRRHVEKPKFFSCPRAPPASAWITRVRTIPSSSVIALSFNIAFGYTRSRRSANARSPKRTSSRALSSVLFWTSTPLLTRQAGWRFFKKHGISLSDDVKTILQSAKSNLNALNTVDFGPKRPFSVGECALCAQMINSIFNQYFTLKMNSNDKMLCGNIANKQKINVLKWPFKFDWSRSSPKTSTSSPIWVIGISPVFRVGRLWGFKRRCQALCMCVFVNPQFKLIKLKPAEIPVNAISFLNAN